MKLDPIADPIAVYVDDYHQLDAYRDAYKLLNLDLKVAEVGFDENKGLYIGLVFRGDFKNAKSRAQLLGLIKLD